MKQILILALILVTSFSFGQELPYNQWAVSGEFGIHAVSDQSALVVENFNHYGLDVRYNINELVGVGVSGGFDNFQLNTIEGDYLKMDYLRVNAEATISLFEILRLRHKYINVLIHGGPGLSIFDTDTDYREDVMNVSGGMTALLKLSRSLALKADYRSTIHISQNRTLDGAFPIGNAGVNSIVDNASLGLVVYFGKGKKKNGGKKNAKEHADWYVPAPVEPIVPVINNITNVTEQVTRTIVQECDCINREYVFFDHDEYDVNAPSLGRKDSQNAIAKTVALLNDDKDSKLVIKGFASATDSSAEYNLELSEKRAKAVMDKIVKMGIDSSRITIDAEGKDFNYSDELVHDMARRVELIVE